MNRSQLHSLIYCDEGRKLDFKRKPWDLSTSDGKGEFIKDLLAMVNADGSTTGYLILGVGDEPDRRLFGMQNQDLSEERLQQVAKEYIEPPIVFTYEEINLNANIIGVIAIPPSKAKPHWARKQTGEAPRANVLY